MQFPGRLHHEIPPWVGDDAIFHIRIRCLPGGRSALTFPGTAAAILASVRDYAERGRWSCYLMLLMPDHLHGLLSFGRDKSMSETIRNWKRARTRFQRVCWQDGYFDHRIRSAAEYTEKYQYIERNPVVLGHCATPEEWPWRITAFHADAKPRFS